MDYKKIHDAIIQRSFNRTLSCYTEKHHIVPKCMGGGNEPSNIAILTAEEHFVIHQLLVKIYPNNKKLAHACQAMSMTSNGQKVSAKLYGWLKNRICEAKSGPNSFWFGKKRPEETRKKMSQGKIGKYRGENNPLFGKKHSDEMKLKMKEAKRLKCKSVIQMDMDGNEISRFSSMREAQRETSIFTQTIRDACRGKYRHAGGFLWKFVEKE